MGALAARSGWSLPDFGTVLRRHILVDRFLRTRPSRTLVVAPGGYGKSVIASQFAASDDYDACLWVDLNGASVGRDDLLRSLYRQAVSSAGDPELHAGMLSSDAGLLLDIEGSLSAWRGKRLCVVLDNIDELLESSSLISISEIVRQCTCDASQTIATARRSGHEDVHGPDSWRLEPRELLLQSDEAHALSHMLIGSRAKQSDAERLQHASGGQVALFCVAARHLSLFDSDMADSASVPADLAAYLTHLAVSHLGARERSILLAASMLGSGSCSDLLLLADCEADHTALARVAECIPVLRLSRRQDGAFFHMHEYAAEVFTNMKRPPVFNACLHSVATRVFDHMESIGQLERLFRLLLRMGWFEEIELRLERVGFDLLDQGHCGLLLEILENVSSAHMVGRPRLLLIKAMALRSMQQFAEALRLARVARSASETVEDGEAIGVQAAIVMARVFIDLGQYDALTECLGDVMGSHALRADSSLNCLALGYLATAYAYAGNTHVAEGLASQARLMLERSTVSMQARCTTSVCCGGILALSLGDFRASGDIMAGLTMDPTIPLGFATQAKGNLAATLIEIGRVDRALSIAREASAQCRRMGLLVLAETFTGTEAAALAGLGEMSESVSMMIRCLDASTECGDIYAAELERNYLATILRADGQRDAALAEAERSYGYLSSSGASAVDAAWAEVELAASLLAVGDVLSAQNHARGALKALEHSGARHHMLRCHLVLAESARILGGDALKDEDLSRQEAYICSGNGNWTLAMYIRAFPGLLGLVAAAVGVDRLPAHMLRMIMPEHARAALPLAREALADDEWKRLAVRLLGEEEAATLEASFLGEPLVNVRLFGGLEVMTPDGVVSDRAWKKRKARLLFMMLVTRQGRDVPRDQLMEHLWPEMDEERAKNNFYVIWSAMKRALTFGGGAAPCPYVEHVGGICRIVRPLVRSDMDEFDQAAAVLADAEVSGDLAVALTAVHRLREVYRADLLPSEIYDDWFRPIRERYRVEFGDAMLRASRMCRDAGDVEQALTLVRAGLEFDSWREDLYQAAIRYQIDVGQRSGAVDLFMACRSKLSEDLGLDPSLETRRLYEEVLAMEDPADS